VPRLIKIEIACGAIPLVAGTAIYVTWRVTRWESLMALGLLNILVGLAMFAVGVGCLLCQSMREEASSGPQPIDAGLRNLLVACLLLVNFPVAFVYVLSADDVMSRVTIRIVNESGNKIDAIAIEGIGVDKHVDPVQAGGYDRVYLRHVGEGGVSFTARHGGQEINGELIGYVVGGEDVTLRFLPDGKFEVGNNRKILYLARD
jgi:hypothetical protein